MDIRHYLESTYLKTPEQSGLTPKQNIDIVTAFVKEAISESFKLVMVRPDMVGVAKSLIADVSSTVLTGTVIDFPLGNSTTEAKLAEAGKAVQDGADELDFVVDYEAFKAGRSGEVKRQVLECTKAGLDNKKTIKWIIEVAALDDHQIVQLSALIKNVVISHFEEEDYNRVYVKSSTGFYVTEEGRPNGATLQAIQLMLENSFPLPVKASGGIKSYDEALQLVTMGVKRIGTSSAKAIVDGERSPGNY